MNLFSSPLIRPAPPRHHEGSGMRSSRDADNTSKNWLKAKTTQAQENANTRAIQLLSRNLAKTRRRIVGGGGTLTEEHFKGEYDSSAETGYYVQYDEVVIASGANSGFYKMVGENYTKGDYPWLGNGVWLKVPNANALGQWQ